MTPAEALEKIGLRPVNKTGLFQNLIEDIESTIGNLRSLQARLYEIEEKESGITATNRDRELIADLRKTRRAGLYQKQHRRDQDR